MKKTILRYGGFSVLFMTLFFLADDILLANVDFNSREIVGWIGIVVSTIFIWFGLRYYRDHHNNGLLSFGQGMKLGLLMLIMPSIAFGIFNVIYVLLNPEFMDTYYQFKISEVKASLPANEAAAELKELARQREMFGSPFYQFIFMAISVFAVGLIVTVISALTLRRSGKASVQPA